MGPKAERWCHLLISAALVLLTIGIGYDFIFGTKLADFLVIITGLSSLGGWRSLLPGERVVLGNSSAVSPAFAIRWSRSVQSVSSASDA